MKERPVLMSAPMVRAILSGRKTQTRRPVSPQSAVLTDEMARAFGVRPPEKQNTHVIACPLGTVGDRLWVRETWAWYGCEYLQDEVLYRADGAELPAGFEYWRPSVHMPRWASRITLEITNVRIERLDEIGEGDAIREGWPRQIDPAIDTGGNGGPFDWFRSEWKSAYGPNSYDDKWVWVIEFRRVDEQSTKSK